MIDRLARGLATRGHDVQLHATGDSTCPVPRRWTYGVARPDDIGSGLVVAGRRAIRTGCACILLASGTER